MKTLMDTSHIDALLMASRVRAATPAVGAEHRIVYRQSDGVPGLSVEVAVWFVETGPPFYLVATLSWSYSVENGDFDIMEDYSIDNPRLYMRAGDRYIIEGDMSDLEEIGEAKWEELQRTRPWEGRT